ncbi:sensor domain-containing protein [Halorubellus sp. PRR65]|uniref:sensor domain-containing protein n=1 Tax=Halorubellus sp. PRR65 TaxID=3098148 RepID=UPI002B259823|nr:sensor domain-containing protein [Halorubellus sp. PRR65]
MSSTRSPSVAARLRAFLGVPVRARTYLNLCYLCLAFPLGIAYLVFVTVGLSLGVGLAVVVVGVPIFLLTVVGALVAGSVERVLARYLLDLDLGSRALPADGPLRDRLVAVLTDASTWKTVVYLPSKLAFGTLGFALATTVLTTGVSMLLVPLYHREPGLYVGVVTDRPVELHPSLYVAWNKLLVGFEAVWTLGAWRVRTLGDALVVAVAGALLVLLGLHALNLLARGLKWYTAVMLDDAYAPLAGGG